MALPRVNWKEIFTWPDPARYVGQPDHTNFVPQYDYNPLEFQSFWKGNQLPGCGMTSDRPETYVETLPGYYADKNFRSNQVGGGLTTIETNRFVNRIYAAYDRYHEV